MVLLGGLATGCSRPRSSRSSGPTEAGTDNPQVLAADGVLCDLTRTMATPAVTVHCLLSGGEDPHSFSLSPEQRGLLEQADLVLINGHGLTPVLATFANQDKAVAVAEAIALQPLETDPLPMADDHDDHGHSDDPHHDDHHGHDHGGADPHVWHNPANTRAMAVVITRELTKLAPEDATSLQALNQEATAVLQDLDAWAERQVETVPPQQRVLATRHKAFGHYARRYGFRELALQGFSTSEAIRPAVLSNLRRELAEANVVVLFPEQDPPGQSLQVIAQQSGIPLSPQHLIADGLAPGRSTVETFVTNTCAIISGLQGQCDEAAGEALVSRWGALGSADPATNKED